VAKNIGFGFEDGRLRIEIGLHRHEEALVYLSFGTPQQNFIADREEEIQKIFQQISLSSSYGGLQVLVKLAWLLISLKLLKK